MPPRGKAKGKRGRKPGKKKTPYGSAENQFDVEKHEALTTTIVTQAMPVQSPVVQQKTVKSLAKTTKQPASKVVPKTSKKKTPKVEKEAKEKKSAKPKKGKSQSNGNEHNAKQAKKQKTVSFAETVEYEDLNQTKFYCICKESYDSERLICDLCSNCFHTECMGLTEMKAKSMSGYVCKDCSKATESTDELYCLCQSPYDETLFYIGCDGCQGWFHGKCVNVLPEEAKFIDKYICPKCQSNAEINHANLKMVENKDYDAKRLVVTFTKADPAKKTICHRYVPQYDTGFWKYVAEISMKLNPVGPLETLHHVMNNDPSEPYDHSLSSVIRERRLQNSFDTIIEHREKEVYGEEKNQKKKQKEEGEADKLNNYMLVNSTLY